MDDKDKQVKEGALGAAGVAKMSAHEGVNLAPKGNAVAQKAEELANVAASREAVVENKNTGLGKDVAKADESGDVTISEVMEPVKAGETMTSVKMEEAAAVGLTEPVTPVLPMPPEVDPLMMADGLEATVKTDKEKPKISRGAAQMKVEPIDSTPLMMRAPEPPQDGEDKMTPDQLIAALNDMPSKGVGMSRREHKWVKLLRGLIWLALAITLPIGAALLVRSKTSECLANGTAAGMAEWGKVIFYASVGVAGANLIWGIVRWFKRWNSEKWGILKVIWKLIRGAIVRILVFTPIVLVTLTFITPVFYNHLAEGIILERAEIMYSGIATSDTQEFLYGEAVPCKDFCGEEFSLRPGEAKYYYALQDEFVGVNVEFTGNEQTLMRILGRQGREWKEIAQFYENMNYTVAADAGYDAFAFAVKNTAAEASEEMTGENEDVPLVYNGSEVASVKMTVLAESLMSDVAMGEESLIDDKCLKVDFDNVVDFPVKMFRMMRELKAGDDIKEVFDGLDQETGTNKLVRHFATVCTRDLKTEIDYNKIQMDLEKAIGGNLRVLDKFDDKSHISMYVTYRPLIGEATGYFLVRAGSETRLVRVKMEEKVPGL